MNHYVPLFEQIVDSSIWCESDLVVKVFMTLLAKRRKNGIVYGNAFNIAQWAKKSEAEVLEALAVLAAPDTRRLEPQPFEGRRIEKVEGGWLLLNAERYQQLMVAENRRHANAAAQARYQAGLKRSESENSTGNSAVSRGKPTLDEVKLIAAKIGLPVAEAEKFHAYYESNGWKVGKNPMKSLNGALSGWKMRYEDNQRHNKTGGGAGRKGFDRNAGTFNAGTTELYDTEKIQAARELRERQSREAEVAGSDSPVCGIP